jgi:hypothetical protein
MTAMVEHGKSELICFRSVNDDAQGRLTDCQAPLLYWLVLNEENQAILH